MRDQKWTALFTTVVLASLLLYYYQTFPYRTGISQPLSTNPSVATDSQSKTLPNVWAELTSSEVELLYAHLHQPHGLNVGEFSSGSQSFIVGAEVLWPNKSTVLAYLDGDGPRPGRYARVSIVEASLESGIIADYAVGPLPPTNLTTVTPIIYNSGRNFVQTPVVDYLALLEWILRYCEGITDITEDLLGASVNRTNPLAPEALAFGSRPALITSERTVQWVEFFRSGVKSGGSSLLPQGLYAKFKTALGGPSTWEVTEWYYNGVLYPNISSFRDAWSSPGFVKTRTNPDGEWTEPEGWESEIPGRDVPPPLSIQPFRPRYELDGSQKHVRWMGFSFYIATHPFTGISLFDIRFDDQRIIYELGLQEAMSHYAGAEPVQSGLEFLDTFFGFGKKMFSLVPGYDCPGHAEYFDIHYHEAETMYTNKNGVCIFEFTSDAPLQRHTTEYGTTISRNTYLVLRSVATVGNYDYTVDYIFYLDGSIEVKVRASGFIFISFHAEPLLSKRSTSSDHTHADNDTDNYGYQVHPAARTSIHDHVINFKADLDICGTDNTMIQTAIEPLIHTYPWDTPEVPTGRHTMHLKHTPLSHETSLNWPRNSGALYLIQSNQTNKWGERRAYRIQPGTGMGTPSHLTIQNSTALGRSAAWSSADLWVLKNHGAAEPASAHHMDWVTPLDPLIDFTRMADGEPIADADLVLYFNLGGHHVPHSGDLPNTLMHTSASSVVFSPFNYFDHDVSRRSRQGVRVDRAPWNDGEQVRYFGARYRDDVLVAKERLEPDLSGHMRKEGGGGDEGGWTVVKNRVAGGLIGLFGVFGRGA